MKLVSFTHDGKARFGAVADGKVIDLTGRLGPGISDMRSFIEAGGDLARVAEVVSQEKGGYDYESVDLLPVIPNPGKIVCVGLNYLDHVEEANRVLGGTPRVATSWPMVFARWPESLAAHRAPILRAKVSEQLDFEAELLVAIGRDTGRYLKAEDALDHVFGYACMNEACHRDYQFHSRQIGPGKNFEQTGATGPWLVTADEIPDPQKLQVEMRLNGVVMQSASTALMIHSVANIIAYVSQWIPLKPGDLIASGTMGGVGLGRSPQLWMKPGDVAEVSIERIGTLRNVIQDEPA